MYHIDRAAIQAQLKQRGIDPEHIRSLHVKFQRGELDQTSFVIEKNRLRIPTTADVVHYSQLTKPALEDIGQRALVQDQVLLFWLNGGAATRYFDPTKIKPAEQERYAKALNAITSEQTTQPKGITPVVQQLSYLELKIRNLLLITERYHLAHHPQVMIMNSFITDQATRQHLERLFKKYPRLEPRRFHYVVQEPLIPRFTKVTDLKNIDLFVTADDTLSFAPCGHGDFVYLVQTYIRESHIPNIQYMFFANIDNLGATLDPVMLGCHINSQAGRTVELAEKIAGDQGGAPCFVDNELMVVEQMKFPPDFDHNHIPWFNTNTFWFTLKDLLAFEEELPLVLAEKTLPEGDVIQLEHFACDVHLPSQFVVIPRSERFWPVKRYVDALIYQDQHLHSDLQHNFTQLLQQAYNLK